jgi:hypothetical protein
MTPTNADETKALPTLELGQLIRQAKAGHETILDIARDTLPDGQKKISLAIGNRKLNNEQPPDPVKAPSPRRAHTFHDVLGFADYINKYGSETTVVLADPEQEIMQAVINEKADRGFEVLTFKPLSHPLFEPWEQLLENAAPSPIRAFVDFVARNRRTIIEPDGRELLLLMSQIRVSRKVEIAQGEKTHSINGVMVESNVQGTNAKNELVELPEVIQVRVPIYAATDPRVFEVDVTVIGTEDRGAMVRVVAGDLINAKTALFEGFIGEVRELTKDTKITLGLGKVAHAEWPTLRA